MNPAGQLDIRLRWRRGAVEGVELNSSRPFGIQRMLVGKTPEQLLTMVPLLFNVCGIAHGAAALEACRRALGREPDHAGKQAREMLVLLETAREHGWRILTDWPAFAGTAVAKARWARLAILINEIKAALFEGGSAFILDAGPKIDRLRLEAGIAELEALLDREVLAGRWSEFLSIGDQSSFVDWLNGNPGVAACFCREVLAQGLADAGRSADAWQPALDEATLHGILTGVGAQVFIEAPTWQGSPCETGALNRQRHRPLVVDLLKVYGNGLLTRLAAILVELAEIPKRLRLLLAELQGEQASSRMAADGIGLAQVEAARGLLIHRLRLDEGQVAEYQIVAPTEWNFHPRGIAVRALSALAIDDETDLRRRAAMLISAIDPCVGYRLTIVSQ